MHIGKHSVSSPQLSVWGQAQHHHFTLALGGLLPPVVRMRKLHDVLDLNCQMGRWALDLALAYPGINVIGVENDARAVAYAREAALAAKVARANFIHANLLQPLPLAHASFDLVHFQSIYTPVFQVTEWPAFLTECRRVMRPGAAINLVSFSLGPGSSEAYNRFRTLIEELMLALNRGFAQKPGIYTSGVYLCHLLRQADFIDCQYNLAPVDLGGVNNAMGRACCQLLLAEILNAKNLFVEYGLLGSQQFDALLTQLRQEATEMAFFATGVLISALAWKQQHTGDTSLQESTEHASTPATRNKQ